ncbi:hypothetical protein [Sphingomonas nostoxanthinifaciens]|uniref:hypothetical protein n=1 Tax=Sphingomonas nostoxanthinifaciens TaxID=2872652 RepID=UPI001CC1FDC4|nr:hypothetical protein [Sphingomonas nostoxanthinifaciens]UAK24257.1 hypothetical protein K8P63_18330 [Sphingomonas nostoxanthinifaciens]
MRQASQGEPGSGIDPAFAFGRERRLHALAHDHWLTAARGRAMPLLDDFAPDCWPGARDNGVLLRLRGEGRPPAITHLGDAFRDETGAARSTGITAPDSLVGRLLARLPEIVAGRTPLQFEARCAGNEGTPIVCRGILLPLAHADGTLGAVLGVITWKALVVMPTSEIATVASSAFAVRPEAAPVSPWGVRPAAPLRAPSTLDQLLAGARTWAALAAGDHTGGTTALHAALGAAFDLLLVARAQPTAFAGLTGGDHATPARIVALTFGGQSIARPARAAYIAALAYGLRLKLGRGGLTRLLDQHVDGLDGIATAERLARRVARGRAPLPSPAFDDGITLKPLAPVVAAVPRQSVRAA